MENTNSLDEIIVDKFVVSKEEKKKRQWEANINSLDEIIIEDKDFASKKVYRETLRNFVAMDKQKSRIINELLSTEIPWDES